MTVELDARNPGEYFAGIGLIHVTGAAGAWDRACRLLTLEGGDETVCRNPQAELAPDFNDAENRLGWPRSSLPVRLQWGRLDCTLMWWAKVTRTGIENSRLKTFAGNKTGIENTIVLVRMVREDTAPETWNDALRSHCWHTSSPLRTDARAAATTAYALGFSSDKTKKESTEDGTGITSEVQIFPWIELLACAGLQMSGASGTLYRIWHTPVPPGCTAAAFRAAPDSIEHRFRVEPDNPHNGKYHAFTT